MGEEERRYLRLGLGVLQGGPGHAVRADFGGQLFGHQRSVEHGLQDRGQHDQGQGSGGDPENLWHPGTNVKLESG